MKILFLCNANMCRSPLAEALLKIILKNRNISATVDSAGFEAYHINEPPEDRIIKRAMEAGIDLSSKRVRLFTQNDFDFFDKIFVMDTLAYRNAMDFARNDEDRNKVDFLLNLLNPGRNEPLPPPHQHDEESFDRTYAMLHKACEKLADSITREQLN